MKVFDSTTMKLPLNSYGLIFASAFVVVGNASAAITMDTVLVGNAGNASDPLTGRGAVAYEYGIGKYEVTVNQYVAFLNAVAATDTYGLFPGPSIGIQQSGSSGSYAYSVVGGGNLPIRNVQTSIVTCRIMVVGGGNLPIRNVSWFDAARFANWMHNGQPTGLQNATTTEGGAYTLNGAGWPQVGPIRNADWRYSLPSMDEWYKAAYHQPASQGGDVDDYWLFPTASNSRPSNAGDVNGPNRANYQAAIPYAVTEVGTFTASASYYGTFDQAGNVAEWVNDITFNNRYILGGSISKVGIKMESTERHYNEPWVYSPDLGFRLVVVPEPTIISLVALGGIMFAAQRRQKI